ncbi:hypothetical protein SDC9_70149 [bioreactor metagenome]|jgi:hypothetical protein|uniref:Uncharacterized protein n=1 Tax=bioreactor metagenome TaxID=1076179 RepID=A0A644Y555_9ZZZZ
MVIMSNILFYLIILISTFLFIYIINSVLDAFNSLDDLNSYNKILHNDLL